MLNAAKNFSLIENPTRQDYLDYKDEINKIRNTVAKKTGGYEMGYVDFVNGEPVPVTPQKSILEGQGDFGPRTTGIKNYFKNAYFHNRLYENFKKNPNDPDFGTLRVEIKKNKYPFIKEIEAEKTYDKIKNLKTPEEFVNLYEKNPNNLFIKSLATATGRKSNLGSYLSTLSRFGKPAAVGTGFLTAMTAALSAKEKPTATQETQTALQDQTVEAQPEKTIEQEVAEITTPKLYFDKEMMSFMTNPDTYADQSDKLYWLADNPIAEHPLGTVGTLTAGLAIPGAKETYQSSRSAGRGPLRSATGVALKGLQRAFTPLPVAAIEAAELGSKIAKDESLTEDLTSPSTYLNLAFLEGLPGKQIASTSPSFLGKAKDFFTLKNVAAEAEPGIMSAALRMGLNPKIGRAHV